MHATSYLGRCEYQDLSIHLQVLYVYHACLLHLLLENVSCHCDTEHIVAIYIN